MDSAQAEITSCDGQVLGSTKMRSRAMQVPVSHAHTFQNKEGRGSPPGKIAFSFVRGF